MRAREGRSSGEVLGDEGTDHALAKLSPEVENVVGDAESTCNGLRVVEVLEGAAASEGRSGAVRCVVELQGDAHDVMPFADEQSGGHRRVDTPGHGHDDPHGLSV